ncbi:MAG: sigma-70 family RNA polymerase sigma factor [Deltaproteobacteria bacterium]|nr:sigma-70 family RNA polymerase sigma factor [Deltaproteobacteria bacterium]
MLTARKARTRRRERAEAPHPRGANAPTGSQATKDGPAPQTQDVIDANGPVDRLVAAAQKGDAAAIEALLARHRPRAIAAALRVLHNLEDAEEAVQEAFLKIWRSLPSFEGRSSFSTWVHRIVTNASLDLMRRCAARPDFVERPEQKEAMAPTAIEPANDETPESQLGDREIEKLVRLAVAALPANHRQVVVLREFEDCSYQEMADIIRCPVGTVMSRLHHARGKLADDLRAPLREALAA